MSLLKPWSFTSRLNKHQANQIKKAIQFRNAEAKDSRRIR